MVDIEVRLPDATITALARYAQQVRMTMNELMTAILLDKLAPPPGTSRALREGRYAGFDGRHWRARSHCYANIRPTSAAASMVAIERGMREPAHG